MQSYLSNSTQAKVYPYVRQASNPAATHAFDAGKVAAREHFVESGLLQAARGTRAAWS